MRRGKPGIHGSVFASQLSSSIHGVTLGSWLHLSEPQFGSCKMGPRTPFLETGCSEAECHSAHRALSTFPGLGL